MSGNKEVGFKHYTLDDVKKDAATGQCWSDVCRSVNVTICTFNVKRLQKICSEYNIDVTHFDPKQTYRRGKRNWTVEELLVKNSSAHRGHLRQLLVRFGLYTGKCAECDISDEWNGKSLTLEIDHINGDSTDNREQNLRWLCPNCHSQTSTYRRRKVETE